MSRCVRASSSSLLLRLLLLLPLLLLLTVASSTSSAVQARSLDGADQRWRDWLLVEDTAPADISSAPGALVRRITPKSVFVAPNFNPGCKEGQQIDSQGKCVQIVRVDQAAHLDFLLKRFNSMFAAPPPPSKKVEKDSPGPFHVSLPLGGAQETVKQESAKPQPESIKPQQESAKPHTSTTLQPLTTTPPPQLTTNTTTPPTTQTTQKTETTTLTMPPSTSFTTDATSELLNFSDESTTSRVTHETLKPSMFTSHTFLASPTTTDEVWSSHRIQTDLGSHRPHTSVETFASHRTQQVFGLHGPQTTTQDKFESQDSFEPHIPQFGSHRPETLPTTQTDVFGSHERGTLPTTQTDVFGSHRPQTLPTTQTDVFESHRTHTLPTTFNTQNPDLLFQGVHRTRPSSLQTSTATAQTSEDSSDRTTSFPTQFTNPTIQTILPFEGIHRTRPSSLHTTLFPAPSTAKTNEVFTLKGFQRTTPSTSHLSFTTTTSATTTFDESTHEEGVHPQESLVFSGDSDSKPFVIIVANNTFKRQEPATSVTEDSDYNSTTESSVTVPVSSTQTVFSHGSDFEDLGSSPTTEPSAGTRFGYFSSVLTPPPTVDEYSLERFPAVEEVPSLDKDSLGSFQQINDDNPRTKCDPSYQVSQVRDGRIISQSSVTNCQPEVVKTTTPQPPMRTVAPTTTFQFPLESQTANRPSYIRFPELPTPTSYNTKLWANENPSNYGVESSKHQNSYYWPQQWNPFPSSVVRGGWPLMDRSQVSSNIYRKQYYQHPVPQWMNKNTNQYSWPMGRV